MGKAAPWTGAGAVAVTTGLALSLTGALPAASDDQRQPTDDRALAAFHDQDVDWAACEDFYLEGLDCATVEVPLDYGDPEGERIHVGVSRKPAEVDAEDHQGVLFTNPGGPGATARLHADQIGSTEAGRAYDVIGMDPRGLGASTRLECEQDPPLLGTHPTDEEIEQIFDLQREYAEGCDEVDGDLRPHITTANTARDMDVVRAVLGEERIDYIGASYGTYLGAVYGTLFPEHLDRAVLDSAVDPDGVWRENFLIQASAHSDNVERYTDWLSERDEVYGLGTTHDEIVATFEETAELLSEESREGQGGIVYDEGYFRNLVTMSAADQGAWDESALLFQALFEGAPLPEDAEEPENPDAPDVPDLPQPPEDPEEAQEQLERLNGPPHLTPALICEAEWPTDPEQYRSDMRELRDAHTFGAGASQAGPPTCLYSERQPTEPVADLTREWDTPALVIAGEFDPRTPHAGGVAMAERLDSPLVTVVDDGGHVFYSPGGSGSDGEARYPCVADAVESYLLDGQDPQDTDCHDRPRPDDDTL
ncbi:alpha/beta fold hydrolase [Nocardiopsis sp. MG754419]|uniref:alpha/beta fold hydrolase n=1 Tax=Nocardiopsis sp. MG754419 TaxID=2259865 RepID=UPI001BA599BD|nr:alpha/beta fold hydrolase [Nocardiopsis sp. MG754419]MBR8741213.1 alpha/beta hydrolase [Nocardiopsis sp. MG754419]